MRHSNKNVFAIGPMLYGIWRKQQQTQLIICDSLHWTNPQHGCRPYTRAVCLHLMCLRGAGKCSQWPRTSPKRAAKHHQGATRSSRRERHLNIGACLPDPRIPHPSQATPSNGLGSSAAICCLTTVKRVTTAVCDGDILQRSAGEVHDAALRLRQSVCPGASRTAGSCTAAANGIQPAALTRETSAHHTRNVALSLRRG